MRVLYGSEKGKLGSPGGRAPHELCLLVKKAILSLGIIHLSYVIIYDQI